MALLAREGPRHPEAGTKLFKARTARRRRRSGGGADRRRDARRDSRVPAGVARSPAAVRAPRREEAEQLRARLAELEAEDLTLKFLDLWLDRADPDLITPA